MESAEHRTSSSLKSRNLWISRSHKTTVITELGTLTPQGGHLESIEQETHSESKIELTTQHLPNREVVRHVCAPKRGEIG